MAGAALYVPQAAAMLCTLCALCTLTQASGDPGG